MSESKDIQQLTPEQHKAVQKFLAAKANWTEYREPLPNTVLPTNYFSLSEEPFPKMAHEPLWIWNQTNRKVTVSEVDEGGELVLQKLNARKRRGCPKAPSYKVWQFTYTNATHDPRKLHALWCEKGLEDSQSVPYKVMNLSASAESHFGYSTAVPVAEVPSIQQIQEFSTALRKRPGDETAEPPPKFIKVNPNVELQGSTPFQSQITFNEPQESEGVGPSIPPPVDTSTQHNLPVAPKDSIFQSQEPVLPVNTTPTKWHQCKFQTPTYEQV